LKFSPKRLVLIAIVLKPCSTARAQPLTKLLSEVMIARSGRTTVPQVFIDGQHIGGCDDLHALDARGGLDPLI
jgi:hypothetical protein